MTSFAQQQGGRLGPKLDRHVGFYVVATVRARFSEYEKTPYFRL